MQRFIAELSKLVDKSEFERSWQSDTARKPVSRWNSVLPAAGFISRSTLIFLANGHLMNFIGFSARLFAESIEAAMSDGFEDGGVVTPHSIRRLNGVSAWFSRLWVANS